MTGKRAIAFDIGDRRIGVAVSDPFNEYAMPCETYFRTRDFDADVWAMIKIAEEKGAGVIVCGMPVNFDGTESVQTTKTQVFVDALRQRTELPVVSEDERFTTMLARETQMLGGVKRENRKKTVDSIAASYILESYLSAQKTKREEKTMNEKETYEDFDEERIVELETDDGGVERLYHIATIEYRGGTYCCFQKAEPETEEEEDEIIIFELKGEDEDGLLVPIEDEALLDEVFAEFCHQYEQYENAEEGAEM